MKITITGILNETPFTLSIWAARFTVCRGIINSFGNQDVQEVIDFKGKRETAMHDDKGYAKLVNTVWEKYGGGDFNSSYWYHKNIKFTSDFIVKAATQYKACRLELKKKKIIQLKKEVAKLEADILHGKTD